MNTRRTSETRFLRETGFLHMLLAAVGGLLLTGVASGQLLPPAVRGPVAQPAVRPQGDYQDVIFFSSF